MLNNGNILSSREVSLQEILETDCRYLYEKWDSQRGNDFAPSWRSFELLDLPTHVIPFCRVVDVLRDPFDLVYRFWGTGLVKVLGADRSGKSLLQLDVSRVAEATKEYQTVIERQAPFYYVYDAKTSKGLYFNPVFAPAIRLPLTDDGETVDKIISYVDFNTDSDVWQKVFEEESQPTD